MNSVRALGLLTLALAIWRRVHAGSAEYLCDLYYDDYYGYPQINYATSHCSNRDILLTSASFTSSIPTSPL